MIHFISDLHLSPRTPGATAILERFLAAIAAPGCALYILGDLFETWVGDDDLESAYNASIANLFATAAGRGLAVSFLHGNRDFLLGEDFARRSGVRLIADPHVLSTPEWQFVLSHGDALCTDDLAYQQFRTQVRDPAWQSAFLVRPLTERRLLAEQMREQSIASQAGKRACEMDLNAAATDDFLRDHGYATFIHGHTHRPGHHDHIVDGIHVERWVLADWHEERGECLSWDSIMLIRRELT